MTKKEELQKELGMTVEYYCHLHKIPLKTFLSRLNKGWSIEKATNFDRSESSNGNKDIKHFIVYEGKEMSLANACRLVGITTNAVMLNLRKHPERSLLDSFNFVLDNKRQKQEKYEEYKKQQILKK